ncbi:signal peptidase I [Mycoplasmatota bacterium]|nr:signal peptidase I [Mycoplasmatota bacterium]
MKIFKKTLHILFYGLILMIVYYLALQFLMPDKTIDYIGFKTFVVLTPSMEPKINVNDMIVVKKAKQEDIEVGDIITFEVYIQNLGQEAYVTHYVGDIDDTGDDAIYYTHGENAPEGVYDKWVDQDNQDINITYDDIAGEYLFKIPNLGFVSRLLQDPYMLAFIVFDVVIIYALVKVIRKKD